MHADLTKVRQSLFNFRSNAAKFTQQGHITLEARHERMDGGDWITQRMSDTGIGMSPEQMLKLLGLHPGRCLDHAVGGTGLGMAIMPLLSDDGRRGDRTERPGRGTYFTITTTRCRG